MKAKVKLLLQAVKNKKGEISPQISRVFPYHKIGCLTYFYIEFNFKIMTLKNILNLKNIKLIIIGLMLGALVILNLFVLNKVISNSPQETQLERPNRVFH